MDTDRADNPRFAIISAIILAVLVAVALWYFFIFRPGSNDAPDLAENTATESPAAQTSPIFAEPEQPVAATPTPVIQGADETPQVDGKGVPPTTPTGPGTWVLAAAVASTIVGAAGLRYRRT